MPLQLILTIIAPQASAFRRGEYVNNSDFSKLKVDTKILVNGKPAYFSYYNEVSGKVYYFADGLRAPIFHSKPIVDICDTEDVEVIEEFD